MNRILFTISIFICWNVFTFGQGNIQVGTNVQMVMNGEIHFVCNEMSLENNGTITPGTASRCSFVSAASPGGITLGGTTVTTFNKLEIQTVDPVVLNEDIQVNDTLSFTSGQLDVNGNMLNLGLNGAIESETMGQSIVGETGGTANASGELNAPTDVNPGNLGMTITSTANLGMTTIARGHVAPTSTAGGYGINRYYDISATNNTGLDATIRFEYLDSELNGIEEDELELFRSTDNGVTWTKEGFDARNATENWVEKSGVDGFSIWTLGSGSKAVLPVRMSYFRAECQGQTVLLKWATASEANNEKFEIEGSKFGEEWIQLGTILGQGTSNQLNTYSFTNTKDEGYRLYRLKQVDFDGTTSYSDIVSAECEDNKEELIRVYPNPTSDQFSVEIHHTNDEELELKLINKLGQIIEERKVTVLSGWTRQEFSLKNLPTGFYELVIVSKHGTRTHKVLKETD